MRIAAEILARPGLMPVMAALAAGGHRALLVGGCVRNALLGEPVTDIDIATDALPESVIACAQAAGLKPVPTGIEHGTITVVAAGAPHEVTTFRRDVETHGRHATVAFSTDVAEDAARRDFTMNALYAEADGTVLDPLGGLADLSARRLRFVGRAEDRIREDYLRILRFFRFHAWYADPEGGIDPEGLAACAAQSEGIATLSRERIGAEMKKLLSAADPAPALAAMAQAGCLAPALPGADPRALPLLVAFSPERDPILRLAALGGEDPVRDLRLSKAEARRLAALREAATGLESPAVLGWRLGAQDAAGALALRAALLEMPPEDAGAEIARGAAATLPVSAADYAARGLAGPALGQALKDAEARWSASNLTATRDDLLT
ncbi:CCA tRNA nucleotidyltransferase [Frigidibacter sp. MR17.14]|uniref:CCA tRNA nucleotidyltransferase n=1 Tax=Frigidibacter sp. MR17.14 TaxID=3126509 RepID=UPI003012E3B4